MIFFLKQKKLIRGSAGHIKAGLGVAADYEADYVELYAPCDGNIETYFGRQGGNWLRIIRPNGDKLEFAHLDIYVKSSGSCKEGDLIAVTGNTGEVTSGPHLHIQILGSDGQRVDPEKYFEELSLMQKPENPMQEKIKSDIRQDNAFSLLVIADDEIEKNDVKNLIMETQRGIWQDSKLITLIPYVSYHKLPVWDNNAVEKICKENFDLSTFQGVAVIYKKGKFREALGQMNPFYKDLGFLINMSYEDPDGDGPYKAATVLEHELLHGFLYLLGMEYAESVHKSPNEFSDDFEQIGRTLEKLYYVLPKKQPEPMAPEVPAENKKNMADVKKWYQSSTGSGAVALRVKGSLVAVIPVAVLVAKLFNVDLSAEALGNAVSSLVSVIEQVGAAVAAVMVFWGYVRSLKVKKSQ